MGTGLAPLSDELTVDEVNKQISLVLAEKGIETVEDLIAWFEDGRAHLVSSPKSAAKELGTTSAFMHAILASNAFRRAYFRRVTATAFHPGVLQRGMEILAADFMDQKVRVRDRLAIFRVVQELFGFEPTQKVQHEITHHPPVIEFRFPTRPEELVGDAAPATVDIVGPGTKPGELVAGDEGDAGDILEVPFKEAGEEDS